jgi:ECF transporter S component (folate family)
MAVDAMLAAMCAVLGYLAIDLGNLKITFESVPILVGALLFGPVDGAAVGFVGTLLYQLLRYGVSATTLLWIAPYVLCGFLVGLYAQRRQFRLTQGQVIFIVVANELLITALNTGVLYVDSKIYGYYSPAFIFGSLAIRFAICIGKALAYSFALPPLLRSVRMREA